MENFGLLWKHIWPKLQFYEYDSLHRLLKLTKIFQTCSLSLFSRQRIIKLHTSSYGFCNFHIVTQPRQLDKRREEGATRACSTVTTEQSFKISRSGSCALSNYHSSTFSLSRKCLKKETNQNVVSSASFNSWIRFSSCDFYHPLFSIRTSFILRFCHFTQWLKIPKKSHKNLKKLGASMQQNSDAFLSKQKKMEKMRLFAPFSTTMIALKRGLSAWTIRW